ncbi:hypothetical protein [Streptomyces sp. AHA2]|uniref:hypothetical protein n=1 Tax=Streptomyces sp. AHA2 TaxID=3064526 RepID=UPI002FDFABA4
MTIAPETPTAPLSPAAAAALARLERSFAPVHDLRSYSRMTPEVRRAVVRYENASAHCRAASAAADFDGCLAAQDEMRMCRCQLEAAGCLNLIDGAS